MTELSVPDFVARYEEAYRSGVPLPWDFTGAAPFVVALAADGGFAGTVLDAGCGTGENAIYLASQGYEVVGVDAAPTALERAREKAAAGGLAVQFVQADVRDLPGVQGAYDTVLDSGLFHLLDEADQARYAATLHRVTRPDGRVHVFALNDNPRNFAEAHRWAPSCGRHGVPRESIGRAFGPGWAVASLAETTMAVHVPHQGERTRYFWLATLRRTSDGQAAR